MSSVSIAKELRGELEQMMRDQMESMLSQLEERVARAVSEGSLSINQLGPGSDSRSNSREPRESPGAARDSGSYLALLPAQGKDRPQSARDMYAPVATAEDDAAHQEHLKAAADLARFRFNVGTLFLLLVNGVADAFEVDCQARSDATNFPEWYKFVQAGLCMGFMIELFKRVNFKGWLFFTGSGAHWHWLQAILVLVQTSEMILIIREWLFGTPFPIGSRQWFRFISMARVLRVFNVLDHLDFTAELHLLLASMQGSMWSLLWSALFMLIPMFIFSMMLTQVVAEYRINSGIELHDMENLMFYYGTLDSSMLSLFWCISGGLSWSEAMIPLRTHHFVWPTLLFLLYVALMVFAVLNVLTGVFVNSATSAASSEKEKKTLATLKNIFDDIDTDASGCLNQDEFTLLLGHKEIGVCLQSLNIPPSHASQLFQLIDADGSGSVQIQEFLQGCDRLQGSLKAMDFATFKIEHDHAVTKMDSFMTRMEDHMRRGGGLGSTGISKAGDKPEIQQQRSLIGCFIPGGNW